MCNELSTDVRDFYLIVSPTDTANMTKISRDLYYDYVNIFCSLQLPVFLQYQNLKNYCHLFSKAPKFLEMFTQVRKYIQTLPWYEREKIMIYSGACAHFMGTIYTEDVDLVYVAGKSYDKEICETLVKKYDVDLHVIFPTKVVELKDEMKGKQTLQYKNNFYRKEMPGFVGVSSMEEILLNPRHNFTFMGIKFMDFMISIRRNLSRSSALTIIDTLLLKRINNIDTFGEFCIKNINVRRGQVVVRNDTSDMDNLYRKAIKFINQWYGIKIDIEYLKKHFRKCSQVYNTIYYGRAPKKTRAIFEILDFNRRMMGRWVREYGQNANYLLDIGVGRCKLQKILT
jgi:hypothetical protein